MIKEQLRYAEKNEAIKAYENALKLDSSFKDVTIALSTLYLEHGDDSKAISVITKYLKQKPTDEEKDFLVKQAALINSTRIKPKFVYDGWAVVNFLKEYKKIKQHLTDEDISLIEPLAKEFSSIEIEALPHCFVHGDVIDTNVIRSSKGKVYILDFSVSNVYPRIQELAVMLCDILFDSNKQRFQEIYDRALEIYQERIRLEKIELNTLPLYVQAAHAMHIVGAAKSAVEDGDSEENDHWIRAGKEGLKFTMGFWN